MAEFCFVLLLLIYTIGLRKQPYFFFSLDLEVHQLALSFALRSQGDLGRRTDLEGLSSLSLHCCLPLGISLEKKKKFPALQICYPLGADSQIHSIIALHYSSLLGTNANNPKALILTLPHALSSLCVAICIHLPVQRDSSSHLLFIDILVTSPLGRPSEKQMAHSH